MECGTYLFDDVCEPWKHTLRSLLVEPFSEFDRWSCGDQVLLHGIAGHFEDGRQKCVLGRLVPFEGLDFSTTTANVWIERNEQCSDVCIPVGAKFGLSKAKVQSLNPLSIQITQNSILWFVPSHDQDFPCNFCHLFCGAYAGWERACQWLVGQKGLSIASTISVDAAHDVMKIWSLQHNAPFWEHDVPLNHSKCDPHCGVLMPIQNLSWNNLCRHQSNLVFSLSPPCQPWSLGGVGMGFNSENGMSMGYAIYCIRIVRPVLALFECADSTPGHSHFKLIRHGLAFAGYKLVWTTISHFHELSAMHRSRWLAVWARNDVQTADFPSNLKISVPGKMPWNHALYSFFIPKSLLDQLLLDDHLEGIYGDFRFLPKGKKSGLSVNATNDQVLRARVLQPHTNMPTLCASYSQQHLLSEKHLLKKGIFAPLIQKEDAFSFIDPLCFLSLLGTPSDQSVICADDIEVLFRHIGNAISTPQALLAILVALGSVGLCRIPIVATVIECWKSRVTREHVIVLSAKSSFVVAPKLKAKFFFHWCGLEQSKGDITLHFDGIDTTFSVCTDMTIGVFLMMCGFENPNEQGIQCSTNKVVLDHATEMCKLQGYDIDIECVSDWVNPNVQCLAVFHVDMQETQIWTCEANHDGINLPQVVTISPHENDFGDVKLFEHQKQIESYSKCFLFHVQTGEKIECFLPNEVNAIDLQQVLQFEIGYNGNCDFQWGECPIRNDGNRIFIVDLTSRMQPDGRIIVLLWEGSPIAIKSIHSSFLPANLARQEGLFAQHVTLNGSHIDMFGKVEVDHGDSIDFRSEQPLISRETFQQAWNSRRDFISTTAECIATDEINFALCCIRASPFKPFCAPILDARAENVSASAAKLQQALSGVAHIALAEEVLCIVPILINRHWCGVEISCSKNVWKIVLVGVPQSHHDSFMQVVRSAVSFPDAKISTFVAPLVSFPGLCGWVLIKRWFKKVGIVEDFLCRYDQVFTHSEIIEPFKRCFLAQGGCSTLRSICGFAITFRSAFFAIIGTIDAPTLLKADTLLFGGAEDDEDMANGERAKSGVPTQKETPNPTDPWTKFDPWMSRTQKQCKWEDLKLAKDHPFVNSGGKSLSQVHKQQLNSNTGGIAFATRPAATDLVKVVPTEPAAILVPASDKPLHPSILPSQISGPFEVVVEDANTGAIYKRQTMLIQIKPLVKYQLASPVYNAKLDDIKEIVLEVDSRLNKAQFEKPLDTFKKFIDEQFPAEVFQGVNIYGYRKFTPNGAEQNHCVHQVMCKLPVQKRTAAIERSLLGPIAVRDFIPKGERSDETSVVPKFWPVDKQSRDEALKATSGLEGFAGLIISKRGIAARCWAKKIGILRKALLPGDDRLCELNINVIPRFVKDSTGWPLAISPGEVIKATYHAVKIAPVPTRCFRVLGVTCWQLSFQDEPDCGKFVVKFNTELHEILLADPGTQINPKQQRKQDKSEKTVVKSQPSNVNSQSTVANDDVADRVSILEAKFQTFEKRQEKVEAQLQSGFDNIHSQLRQVLNAVSQPREKTPTGETPPPKFPKNY